MYVNSGELSSRHGQRRVKASRASRSQGKSPYLTSQRGKLPETRGLDVPTECVGVNPVMMPGMDAMGEVLSLAEISWFIRKLDDMLSGEDEAEMTGDSDDMDFLDVLRDKLRSRKHQ